MKSVAFTSIDVSAKKNSAPKNEEKPSKHKKAKKKLPSLSDQELNKTDDEDKKTKGSYAKQGIDSIQGLIKLLEIFLLNLF